MATTYVNNITTTYNNNNFGKHHYYQHRLSVQIASKNGGKHRYSNNSFVCYSEII